MLTTAARIAPSRMEIDAARSEICDIAAYLQGHLGQKLTAYLSGLKDPKTVGQWAMGKVEPRDIANLRLRHGYVAARLIADAFGDETAKAWLFGSNSQLGGEAPAWVLRHGRLPEDVTPVVRAAAGFVESAHGPNRSRAADDAGEALQEEAHRLARLLAAEIRRYDDEPAPAGERDVASEIRRELLGGTEPVAERIRALELARQEIAERLGEVVEHMRSDLAGRSERAGR